MSIVRIECRDKYAYDVEMLDFSAGLSQFPGAVLSSGQVHPHATKDGAANLIEDPVVQVDDALSDPEEVRQYIEESKIFRLREQPVPAVQPAAE